eukprot:3034221-Rhodomonas_salina.1
MCAFRTSATCPPHASAPPRRSHRCFAAVYGVRHTHLGRDAVAGGEVVDVRQVHQRKVLHRLPKLTQGMP